MFRRVDSTDFRTLSTRSNPFSTPEWSRRAPGRVRDRRPRLSVGRAARQRLRGPLTSIHFAADTLVERRYGSRLLAALFSFEDARSDQTVYWVYSFRRGAYYPFAPDPHDSHERNASS